MSHHTINLEINNRTLSIEINKVATQADGSALIRYGDTVMFVSATSKKDVKEPKPFLPLIVDYRENTYARVRSQVDSSNERVDPLKERSFSVA